jgi:membrane protease YdiL (CAAX protease family)
MSHDEERSLRSALRVFVRDLRDAPRGYVLILLAVTVLCIAAYYVGSRRFYASMFFDAAAADPLFSLHQHLYWFISYFVLFLLAPMLLIRFVHHGALRDYGLTVGDWRFGMRITVYTLTVMLPVLWFVSADPAFRSMYPHAAVVRDHWNLLLLYETVFLLYFLGWEFVWRGYMLFGLAPFAGKGAAMLLQALPFVLLHFGKPPLETIGAIPAALLLAGLAFRTRSYFYGVLIHWMVMGGMDVLATLRYRSGVDGSGLEALRAIVAYITS